MSGGTNASHWYTQDSPHFGLIPGAWGGCNNQTRFFMEPISAHTNPFQQILRKSPQYLLVLSNATNLSSKI